MAGGGCPNREAFRLATLDACARLVAGERIAGDRRRGRCLAQQLGDRRARADKHAAARRLEPHAITVGARHEGGEARPAGRGLRRVVGDDIHLVQAQRVHIGPAPQVLGRELLDVLDAPLGHFLRRQPHDLEARRAARDLAREIDERLRLEAMRREPPLFARGVRRAVAKQVDAVIASHQRAHALGGRRVVRRREQLDVARFQHHATIGGAHRPLGRALHGDRRHAQPERLAHARRRVEIDDEVRDVIEVELARRRPLPVGGVHAR